MISRLSSLRPSKIALVKLLYICLFILFTTSLIAKVRQHHQNKTVIQELNQLCCIEPVCLNEAKEINSIQSFEFSSRELDALYFIDNSLSHSLEEPLTLVNRAKLEYENTVLHSNLKEQKLLVKLKSPLNLSGKNLNLLLKNLRGPLNLQEAPAKLESLIITKAGKNESSNLYNVNFSFSCTKKFSRS